MFAKVVFWGLTALAFASALFTVVAWIVAAWTLHSPEVQGAWTTTGVITLVVALLLGMGAVIYSINNIDD